MLLWMRLATVNRHHPRRGDPIMLTATFMIEHATISQCVRDVRATWTPRERRQRAREGRHRFREFLGLIAESPSAPEIWAVGAPAEADLQRLAYQS
jgi:hypothetical protein